MAVPNMRLSASRKYVRVLPPPVPNALAVIEVGAESVAEIMRYWADSKLE